MKKLIIIAAIVGVIYWYKNRKVETAATEAAEPTLKSAWLLSSSASASGSDSSSSSSDSSSSSTDSSSSTSDGSTSSTDGSGSVNPGSRHPADITATFGSLEKPKSCFR